MMVRTAALFLMCLAGMSTFTSAFAQPATATERIVRALDDEERRAALRRDVPALERLWSVHFTVNAPNNQVVIGRRAVLEAFIGSGIINFSSFERQIEHVRIDGPHAFIMGLETLRPLADAPSAGLVAGQTVRRRFTNIWKNENGTWRLYARHANVMPSSRPAAREAAADTLRAAERARIRALVDADVEAARALHAEDFQLVTPLGDVVSREQYLGGIASGHVDYLFWEPDSITVRWIGDGAVIRYQSELEIVFAGQRMPRARYWHTDAYERRNGQWQVVWSHATAASVPRSGSATPRDASSLVARVDHLVYATPDLERGIAQIETLLGIRATAGGQHPGRGTRNALVALGPRAYLEIIGPDPDQPAPSEPRMFGIDTLAAPRLVAWFANGANLPQLRSDAAKHGVQLGEIRTGSRRRPDGTGVSWRFTDPLVRIADGVVPLFIDWGATPHPAQSAAPGASLMSLRAEHPDPGPVQNALRALGIDLPITAGERPALIAMVDGPRGRVEIR